MKHWYQLREWSITQRLVLVCTGPLLLMFVALSVAVYLSGKQDVIDSATTHGEVLAQALSETSRYGVVSGNTEALERAVRRFVETDRAIASIQILDDRHRVLIGLGTGQAQTGLVFESAIVSDVADVDVFSGSSPSVSAMGGSVGFKAGPPVGFVLVSMSSLPVLEAQRRRLYLAVAAMVAAFAIAGAVGLYLARRLIRRPLTDVMVALREIRQGRLSVRFNQPKHGEIGELQSVIEEMSKGLSLTRQDLENEVRTRTHELHEAVAARQRLIAHSNDLVEEERRRIALDLHDQFNASLLAIRLRASALLPRDGVPVDQSSVGAAVIAITDGVNQLYADARRMVKRLRPEVLDTLGLGGAISEAVRLFNENQQQCTLSLLVDENMPHLQQKVAIAAYRAVQEAISNILKHADATRGRVAVRIDEPGRLEIEVRDNGLGFDVDHQGRPGFGLLGMRERVESAGGTLILKSKVKRGTKITMSFPALPAVELDP